MEIDESAAATTTTKSDGKTEGKKEVEAILPESDVYLRLLVIVGLIDVKEVEKVSFGNCSGAFGPLAVSFRKLIRKLRNTGIQLGQGDDGIHPVAEPTEYGSSFRQGLVLSCQGGRVVETG